MKFSVTTMWERTETSSIHKDPNLWEEAHDRPSSHILGCMNSIALFGSLDQWVGTSFSKSGLNEQYAIVAMPPRCTNYRDARSSPFALLYPLSEPPSLPCLNMVCIWLALVKGRDLDA
jgi:hypothetical protein